MSDTLHHPISCTSRFGRILLLILLTFLFPSQWGYSLRQHADTRLRVIKVLVLWNSHASGADSTDQESFKAILTSMGFPVSRVEVTQLEKSHITRQTLLAIPRASAMLLSDSQVVRILRGIRLGGRLITDGVSRLSRSLGMEIGESRHVRTVIDNSVPAIKLSWADEPNDPWISAFPNGSSVLFSDSATGHSLGVSFKLGRGRCLYSAPLLDDISGKGYARFPFFVHAVSGYLRCLPAVRSKSVDAYFDPGYRFAMPIETLAVSWHRWGIRAVHAAAWYSNRTPPYDYRRLIQAAHEQGILVYAWLEWPHVGVGFWNDHPLWRQKNALLQDAKLDFLHLMDLQNRDCLEAAFADLSNLLKEDWDGVDVAEFTITGAGGEALEGPARPDYFVSFADPARKEFQKLAGFDPLELENQKSPHYWQHDTTSLKKFYRYRTDVNNRLLRQVFEFIRGIKEHERRDWELIHTIVDNSLHPEFDQLLGFDLKSTLRLVKDFAVTLNVEDPYMEWIQPPDRYRRLRRTLHALLPERPSMIDINIVPVHPSTQFGFASPQATGTELLQQLQAASEGEGRVCIYCESSVYERDWRLMPYASASGVTLTKSGGEWKINAPHTLMVRLTGRSRSWSVDGKPWPCFGSEGVLLPAGEHRLSVGTMQLDSISADKDIRLVDISDELLESEKTADGIALTYAAPARCLLSFSGQPVRVLLDGSNTELPVVRSRDRFVVMAPSGTHRLSIHQQ